MNVQCVKLVTGHDLLVSKVEDIYEENLDDYKKRLYDTYIIQIIPTQEGAKLSLMPWPNFSSNLSYVDIKEEHILCIINVDRDIENGYRETVTGLSLPSSKLVVPT